jgi:hypothetical protein
VACVEGKEKISWPNEWFIEAIVQTRFLVNNARQSEACGKAQWASDLLLPKWAARGRATWVIYSYAVTETKTKEEPDKEMQNLKQMSNHTGHTLKMVLTLIGFTFALMALSQSSAYAKTITVTGTGDTIALDGKVTLREAITAANTNTASGDAPAGEAGFDMIKFDIPGGAFQMITLNSDLPAITNDPTVIDGTSQPGYAGTPVIELNGNNAATTGLFLQAGSCTVKGLVINRFKGNGIIISGKSLNLIVSNYIGTNANGTVALGNGQDGISLQGSTTANSIGGSGSFRNVISGNGGNGIGINSNSDNNVIQNNYIGTNAAGTSALGNGSYGVRSFGANNVIGGIGAGASNLISGNSRGVGFEGTTGTGNQLQGNLIGTDAAVSVALGNDQEGVYISGPDNTIGGTTATARNIISGNRFGVNISGKTATGNQIQGNYIGTNLSGDSSIGNTEAGVVIYAGANNSIGGTGAGAGNVISGNAGDGVDIQGGATDNKIQGNFIGTNAAGTVAVGNSGEGVRVIGSPKTLIGGAVQAARNIISGNHRGVTIEDASTGSLVQGNYIGTDVTGSNALGNTQEGVSLYSCSGILIGGTVKGVRNVISGNANDGVRINGPDAAMNLVQGNYIGTKADGVTILPNSGAGIDVFGAFNNTFGGTLATAGNVIAGNGYAGVLIQSGSGNALLGNAFFKNARLGIDLNRHDPIGLLANDQGDPDFGANKWQNYPLLTSVMVSGGNTTIQGKLNSTPNKQFRIEFFANSACSNSGFGEGQVLIGATSVTTDPNGDVAISATLPVAPAGQFITATATSPGGDTSEFSPCALVGGPNPGAIQFVGSVFLASETDGTATITVTRSSGMLGAVNVHYATSDGSATAPADYATTSGNLTFNDGEVIKTFTIPVVDDGASESQESLNLTLSAPTGGAALGSQSTSSLYINDSKLNYPGTSFSDASAVEGETGTRNAVFHITVTPHAGVMTVSYATADGTATAGSDYQAVSGTLTFNPGETSKDVVVPIIGDTLVEGDEVFFLIHQGQSAGYVDRAPAEGIIIDDEGLATLSLSAATYNVNENGGSLDIHVKRAGGNGTAMIDYATSDGGAAAGSDYATKTGTLSFNSNETDKVITVLITNDTQNEVDETFNFKLSNPSNAISGSPNAAVVTIKDDDVVGVSIANASSVEGNSGVSGLVFSLTLSAVSSQTVAVDYATTPGTATGGVDYQAATGTLTFAPGETSKEVTVIVNGDTQDEPDETFFVQVSNPLNAVLAGAQGLGTIIDDDAAPLATTIQLEQSTYTVSEGAHYKEINVTRVGDVSADASVDYTTTDMSATQRTDYNIMLGTLYFGAGESVKTLTLLITEDSYVEGDEALTLTLSSPAGAALGAQSVAQVTITDNDSGQNAPNAIDDMQTFVRQQYHDFLNREPDPAGFQGWQDILGNCAPGDAKCDRIEVSSAFYRSQEFHDRGYFIYRFYSASLGHHPQYMEFMRDLQKVSGFLSQQQQEEAKVQFITEFINRPEFKQKYDAAVSAAQYVDALASTAAVILPNRDQLVAQLQNNQLTRGEVLRQIIESQIVDQKFFNEGFVIMQYFGYLRRDADILYLDWIETLNQTNDYRLLVNGFVNSIEYRQRFGQ